MLVGIDIGGTFTDIVAIQNNKIFFQHKISTTDNILDCVLNSLDCLLLQKIDTQSIKRLCISTTLITNIIVKNNLPETSLLIMPGPGMNSENSFPVQPNILTGYINHLGNVTSSANPTELDSLDLKNNIAISGKFSVRNPENELILLQKLQTNKNVENIVTAHSVSGKLNFIRRTNTAYYAAATKDIFYKFSQKIIQAANSRGLNIPIVILKADAGTINLKHSANNPAEFIFTGPAASVLGIKALIQPQDECIALDIGGTTTDISFWRDGDAILNDKGAKIAGFNTSINTFYLHSIGLGGNSLIHIDESGVRIGPDISTNFVCLGGDRLTLTDILVALDKVYLGNKQLVFDYLLACGKNIDFVLSVFKIAVEIIASKINELINQINYTPVYTVAHITSPKIFNPLKIIGVGGAAYGIVPALAQAMGIDYVIPAFAQVANAVGAALARPTIVANIQANTLSGYYTLSQESLRHQVCNGFDSSMAKSILLNHMHSLAASASIHLLDEHIEIIEFEEYPVLSGYHNSGLIINITMQIKPDILINTLN